MKGIKTIHVYVDLYYCIHKRKTTLIQVYCKYDCRCICILYWYTVGMLGMARHTCSVMLFWSVSIISRSPGDVSFVCGKNSTLKLCYCDAAGHQINTNIPYTLLWCIDLNNRTHRATSRNLVRQMTSLGFWINNWSVRSKILSELWVWTQSLNSDSEPWL